MYIKLYLIFYAALYHYLYYFMQYFIVCYTVFYIIILSDQERIEPAKPAREHPTSIDGEIQTLASGY